MKNLRLWVAIVALFYCPIALAQNGGTVTSHAFAVGKGAGKQGFTSVLCGLAQVAVGQTAADPICQSLSGDVTIGATGVTAIGANKVTLGMHSTLAVDSFIGNLTGSVATPAAFAFPNCASALIYSTSTHVLGCSVSAGTGTVTNVGTAGLATGGPITATGTVTVTAASKTDEQTGTSAVVATTPSQQQQHDSALKAHAYVTQSGTTMTVQSQYNVSGVTRTGSGTYTVTFATAFASATGYDCAATVGSATASLFALEIPANHATGSWSFQSIVSNTGIAGDLASFGVQCAGRQ